MASARAGRGEIMSINWSMLIIGGLFETGFAVSLGKRSRPAASLSHS